MKRKLRSVPAWNAQNQREFVNFGIVVKIVRKCADIQDQRNKNAKRKKRSVSWAKLEKRNVNVPTIHVQKQRKSVRKSWISMARKLICACVQQSSVKKKIKSAL